MTWDHKSRSSQESRQAFIGGGGGGGAPLEAREELERRQLGMTLHSQVREAVRRSAEGLLGTQGCSAAQ